MKTKPDWVKATPYEDYLRGTADAALYIRRDMAASVESLLDYGFNLLSKRARPHARGMIAQAYGINLAPGSR